MRLQIDVMMHYGVTAPVDVLLAVEVAPLPDQILITDLLRVSGVGPLRTMDGDDHIGRRTWMRADYNFIANYTATVDVDRARTSIEQLPITPVSELPAHVIPYVWPSRYCESDRFESFVTRQFTGETNGAKILAMVAWIRKNVDYVIGSSDARTSAVDIFVSRKGVCRDFAHLLASFARAAGVPARLVSAYAWQLEPQDFHAVVEVWLGGAWHLVDPTELAPEEGLVKIGVGRDATDIAFMTSFGYVGVIEQRVTVEQITGG